MITDSDIKRRAVEAIKSNKTEFVIDCVMLGMRQVRDEMQARITELEAKLATIAAEKEKS